MDTCNCPYLQVQSDKLKGMFPAAVSFTSWSALENEMQKLIHSFEYDNFSL